MSSPQDRYRLTAERSWRWVLDEVRWQDGPWIPVSATVPAPTQPGWDRDGLHSGVGGLAHVLAEIRLSRSWTAEEERLADGISERVTMQVARLEDATYFDGLVSTIGALIALGAAGAEPVVARLAELATEDGWPQTAMGPPKFPVGTRLNDLTLGTAGVLLGATWAARNGAAGAIELAETAASILLAEAEETATGLNWRFAPRRFAPDYSEMPNLSHGLAGVATALAVAGAELGRPELVLAAARGAGHLVTLGDTTEDGFIVPRTLPRQTDDDAVTYTWCHGPTGTSLLFVALEYAGVEAIAGETPTEWQRRCLHSVRTSGLPARLRPGFWDNDGRCCGTAGVADVFLDSWQRTGTDSDREFAFALADVLVERALSQGTHAYWRFIEHKAAVPLLPPGVGWMQGAAGISAFLFRAARLAEPGTESNAVPRMDNWWAVPPASRVS